jgi:ribosomal protein S18 acetylase RimI-like enzyme
MEQPIIRMAASQDIVAMANLLAELFSIEKDFQIDPQKQQYGLQMLMGSRNAALFVAESNGKIIGMVTVQMLISTAQGGKVGVIEDLIVTKTWRGKGIGRSLLETIKNWAQARGISRLQLLADKYNQKALNFYQREYWQPTRLVSLWSFL